MDSRAGKLYRIDDDGETKVFAELDGPNGTAFHWNGDCYLADPGGMRIARATPGGEVYTVAATCDGEPFEGTPNDLTFHPSGSIYFTAPNNPLDDGLRRPVYRIDPDGAVTHVFGEIGCSNGMGFTLALDQIYYTDSAVRHIYVFDYDRASGELSKRRLLIEVPEGEGIPDGLTVDSRGDLWSARWGGSGVWHYNSAGEELGKIELPAKQISSVIFGGDDLMDIYLTSAGGDDQAANGELAGALFRVRAEVPGRPEFFSKIKF